MGQADQPLATPHLASSGPGTKSTHTIVFSGSISVVEKLLPVQVITPKQYGRLVKCPSSRIQQACGDGAHRRC